MKLADARRQRTPSRRSRRSRRSPPTAPRNLLRSSSTDGIADAVQLSEQGEVVHGRAGLPLDTRDDPGGLLLLAIRRGPGRDGPRVVVSPGRRGSGAAVRERGGVRRRRRRAVAPVPVPAATRVEDILEG